MTTLSFAIPTYNRAEMLKETIENIAQQIADSKGIDIIISDNASTDNTKDIVETLQITYPYIKYYRNDINLGMDRNFCNAVEKSTGEYVWLFGDDDKLVEGGLDYVLTIFAKYSNISLIYANWGAYNETLTQCLRPKIAHIEHDIIFRNADDFLSTINTSATFLTSLIVKKDLWLQVDESQFFDTHWVHFGVTQTLLKRNETTHIAYAIAEPLIKQRNAKRWQTETSTKELELSYVSLPKILRQLATIGYSETSINKFLAALSKYLHIVIIKTKGNNAKLTQEHIHAIVNNFQNTPHFWSKIFPLFFIPNIFFTLILILKKNINLLYNKNI